MKHRQEFKPDGLRHGGRILTAAKSYNIPVEEWLDLSTGLNPGGWPVPHVPANVWQALPEDDDGLQTAACDYYGCEYCLPVSGSQAAIQTLPALRSLSKVGILSPTYAEHEYNWTQAGHQVTPLTFSEVESHINELDVLVVINPNNPTGKLIEPDVLTHWHRQISSRGGWLIVDEAFMDVSPEKSLAATGIKPGLIILRSMGKFFGLAGIRCGFVISDRELLQRLSTKLGPWQLTGPTRYIAKQALQDKAWQENARKELVIKSHSLFEVLDKHELTVKGSTAFFQWLTHHHAKDIYHAMAQQGILLRYFDKTKYAQASLRFGLPANHKELQRLDVALENIAKHIQEKSEEKNYV